MSQGRNTRAVVPRSGRAVVPSRARGGGSSRNSKALVKRDNLPYGIYGHQRASNGKIIKGEYDLEVEYDSSDSDYGGNMTQGTQVGPTLPCWVENEEEERGEVDIGVFNNYMTLCNELRSLFPDLEQTFSGLSYQDRQGREIDFDNRTPFKDVRRNAKAIIARASLKFVPMSVYRKNARTHLLIQSTVGLPVYSMIQEIYTRVEMALDDTTQDYDMGDYDIEYVGHGGKVHRITSSTRAHEMVEEATEIKVYVEDDDDQ